MVDSPASAVLNSGPVHQAVLNALDQLGLAVLVKDLSSGRYVYASDAASRLLHAGDDALEGVQDADIFDATQAVALRAADVQAASMPNGLRSEHRMELRGARRDFRVWRQQVALEGQSEPHMLSLWQDITEAHQREAQIAQALAQLEQQQKANDALRRDMEDNQVRDTSSGLYHRVHFDEQLRREADLSSREQREFALVAMAIDNMDEIRRLHGVEACERVVESLGRLLRANTRAMDSPCRLGGDRFVVLLSGIGLATAHARMEHLRRHCAEHIVPFNGQQIPFTVSMGVSSFPHTAGIVDELLRSADRALASARDKGGNRIALASIQFVPGV